MKKNKGIIVTGGKLKAENITIGKKAKIEQIIESKEGKKAKVKESSSMEDLLIDDMKKLISNGELNKVIEQLLVHFQENKNKEGLNAIIMHSASLTQLEMRENLGVITHEQEKTDRARITNSILQLIDKLEGK